MAAAFVQATQGGNNATGTTLATAAFGSSTTNGNAILVAVAFDNSSASTATVTDSKGNTYTAVTTKFVDANNQAIQMFYCLSITGGASHTVTLNTPGSETFRNIVAHEVSGLLTSAALDVHIEDQSTSATPATGSVTTTTAGQYIFAAINNDDAANTHVFTASGSYTEPANGTSNAANGELQTQYQVQGAAGAITGSWTRTASGHNVHALATFKATGGSPPSTDPARIGWFDPELSVDMWFGKAARIEAWFDGLLVVPPAPAGASTPDQLAFHRPFSLSRLAAPFIAGAIAWAPQPISAPTGTATPTQLGFVQPFTTAQLPKPKVAPSPAWTPQTFSAPAFGWFVPELPVTAPKIAAAGRISWTPQASFSLTATPADISWHTPDPITQAAKPVAAGPINWTPRPFDALPFGWFKSSLPAQTAKPTPAGAVSWAAQELATAAVTPAPLEWYRQFNTARAPQAVAAPQVSWSPATIQPLAATPGPLEWLQPTKPQGLAGLVAAPAVRWTPQGFSDPAFGWYVPTLPRDRTPAFSAQVRSPTFVTPPATPSFGWSRTVAPVQLSKLVAAGKVAWAPQPVVVTVTLPPIGWLRQTPIVQLPPLRAAGPVKFTPLPILNPVSMIYVWDGSAFVLKPMKVWDGFAW